MGDERVFAERPGQRNSAVLERLQVDHERLAESLSALEALLVRLDDDSAARAFVLHLEFTHEFCELLHFPLEDALLEVVLEAGLTPSERRVVFVNLAQHQVIYAEALTVLEQPAAEASSEPGPRAISRATSRAEFRRAAEAYVRALRGHLEFEDRHLQPLLRRHLTTRATARVEALARDLLATLVGKPLERLAALDATSRELAAG